MLKQLVHSPKSENKAVGTHGMFDEGRKLRWGGRKGRRNLKVIIHGEQPQSKSFSLSLPNTGFPRAPSSSPMAPTPSSKLWVISPIHPNLPHCPARQMLSLRILMLSKDMTLAHGHTCTHIKKHGLASQVTTLSQAEHSLFKGICPS